MVEVIKVYRERFPSLRLIGKRYTDKDRDSSGSFGSKWNEWFEKGYFKTLEELGSLPENGDAYLGCMRCADEFEYWIGMFFPEQTPIPEGYMYVDIPSGDVGTCWIYGRDDNGEIYGRESHDMCLSKINDEGWQVANNAWVFELYNCPRFTTPDENGKVILDYCIYLRDE
ncbi:GyrI-like domain-containing protein [Proteiniborus sp. MB09-C3]|uniref:GyrI-like domain-containing protein n=1 Tax=Proteiniborus sp. MB09-C3 TaxID=3050072 RepID=UPI00255454E1|nr:GyrI-like domain-containing protein [Proteiniborus sp. MB09-C3]WIV11520.1 GyrI-like domain-containing protein [Proteiniborus sp. MB09-C3]